MRGPYGSTRGFKSLDINIDNGLCVLKATFFYPADTVRLKKDVMCSGDDKGLYERVNNAEFPIYNSMDALEDVKESYQDDNGRRQKRNTGEKKVIGDLYKKIQTNTISKALSML
jgi:hypothetical protein